MKIEIFGTGCAKCNKLFDAAKDAVAQAGIEADVVKVSDLMEIASRGVLMTPALAVDGEIKISGRAPKAAEIAKLIA